VDWAAIALGVLSAACAAMALLVRADRAVALALQPLDGGRGDGAKRWADILQSLGRTRWAGGSRDLLRRRLELAGGRWPLDAILGLRIALPAFAIIVCLSLAPVVPTAALVALPVGAAAFRCPDFVMARLAKRRQERVAAQVPDLGELLLATTQAGLTPLLAFRRSAEALEGPLGDELALALRQMELGVSWRAALESVTARVDDAAFRRLVSALSRTQRLGTPIAGALRTVADDLRGERRTIAEERARRAPVKMLFPLVFLILPAFLLLTVGPVVLATIRSLR
jgi:tight adherence protein C